MEIKTERHRARRAALQELATLGAALVIFALIVIGVGIGSTPLWIAIAFFT